jgi:hypothetical protein
MIPYANEIVSSMIRFEITVRANIFIGNSIVSWSYTQFERPDFQGKEWNLPLGDGHFTLAVKLSRSFK